MIAGKQRVTTRSRRLLRTRASPTREDRRVYIVIETIGDAMPTWAKKLVPQTIKDRLLGVETGLPPLQSVGYLRGLMQRYQVKDLINVDPASFKKRVNEFLHLENFTMEGYDDPATQRDLSIRFHWGHNHDFGEFFIPGKLGDRHIFLIASLIDWFKVLPSRLDGCRILDIGCWTGGTSLLLAAMGAHVVAIEEVKKYIDCLQYMAHAFKLDSLEARSLSLYDCSSAEFQDAFDIVLFPGVLYH